MCVGFNETNERDARDGGVASARHAAGGLAALRRGARLHRAAVGGRLRAPRAAAGARVAHRRRPGRQALAGYIQLFLFYCYLHNLPIPSLTGLI